MIAQLPRWVQVAWTRIDDLGIYQAIVSSATVIARGQSLAALVHLGDTVPSREGARPVGDRVGDGVNLDARYCPHRSHVDLCRHAGADQAKPE